ncbi:MAG: L-glutamate gamma-semialdehyde dehydrogenase [Candidatus Dormibacteraeota bacterium]|uniref:L-glutamate gamma-semialdehyde dehydrogenase n=1 Tax=Candidatus Aeolococcus gillhamiae TaxID=3127015 RepID=A0A2W6AJZ2_9BACT|nr:L-glutamate gamma-semialdehyde dehydrogenase [Candidatus Dormibacteraeota bacterium]PZR78041.1 MAG: 1-pyrroline-5-carboxylate dehydrogenase [Candidatus Dormibacter sp. RRmetagenome_bin12]
MSVQPPPPRNEPLLEYRPGSPERAAVRQAIDDLTANAPHRLPLHIDGSDVEGTGQLFTVIAPHRHQLVLGEGHTATEPEVTSAIVAALRARREWAEASFESRAAVFLRAADLLAGPWRARVNAATMLGQSKTVYQAEIDAAAELVDFWRFNVHFAAHLNDDQPISPPGVWNRMELRALEGFVLAITPFNFTSIAGNLPTAPAIMGNTVVWKPATTQQLAATALMQVLEEAGLPPGVINMVTGHSGGVAAAALPHPDLAGIHFTGSTGTFHSIWSVVSDNLGGYRTYPRLVGETGGKDFVVVHESASMDALLVGLLRGAFEYQGQKCSAASRAYVPQAMWDELRGPLAAATESLPMGDPTDMRNFMGAVIDQSAFRTHADAITAARADDSISLVAGGECDDSEGWFVRPTIFETPDPHHDLMERELFGPILTVHPYEESDWETILRTVDGTSPYALTGAVFASDRGAIDVASRVLRNAAGNFYINDKPTGAVVGQQPFGGARTSGTNDKAGSPLNLLRWVSARTIKETFNPPTDWRYPHQLPD